MKIMQSKKMSLVLFFALSVLGAGSAALAEGDKGVGPVSSLKLEALDAGLAAKGKATFGAKCSACHKMDERYVGPPLKDVTKRRTPEWVMNMILNPAEMLEKNDTAKELLGEFMVPMTFQNVSQEEARAILEYFRYYAEKGDLADKAAKKPDAKKAKTKK